MLEILMDWNFEIFEILQGVIKWHKETANLGGGQKYDGRDKMGHPTVHRDSQII